MAKTAKTDLLNKFKRLYKGCTLYAIHLDGFSHAVFYKDEDGERHVDGCSAYAPEQYDHPQKHGQDGIWRSFNEDKTKVLFLGYAHYCYQGNAKEYVYKDVREW